jgi:hypothetical protein
VTPEVFDAWYRASREAQGLGEQVEDEAVLVRLARLLAGADQHDDGAPDRSGRRRLNRSEPIPARQPRDSRES